MRRRHSSSLPAGRDTTWKGSITARAAGSSSPAVLLKPGETVHRHHPDLPTPGLVALGEPGLEDLLGPARGHAQKPSRTTAIAHGGHVDNDGDIPVAPPGVAPHRGSTSHMGAKRAGNYQPPRTSTPLNRSGTSLRICSAQVRTAAGGGVPGHSQSGCYPGDQHALQGKGTQPPLHRRAGQPRPWLSQGRGVLPPHSTAVGTGEAPPTHHQLREPPPHRHVNQTPDHRPTSLPLGPAGLTERVLEPRSTCDTRSPPAPP